MIQKVDDFSEPPGWTKNMITDRSLFDGDVFLIAVPVINSKTSIKFWDIDKIKVTADEDLFYLEYADSGDSFDIWEWEDVAYYISLS